MNGLTIDGTTYNVRVSYETPMTRSFIHVNGPNAGTAISGRAILDVIGIKRAYTVNVSPDPDDMFSYNSMITYLRSVTGTVNVTVPWGTGGAERAYTCVLSDFSDSYYGDPMGQSKWGGLRLTFTTVEPVAN